MQSDKGLPLAGKRDLVEKSSDAKTAVATTETMDAEKPPPMPTTGSAIDEVQKVGDALTDGDQSSLPDPPERHLPRTGSSRRLRWVSLKRQEMSARFLGGFGELNLAVKLHQKIGLSTIDGKYVTLHNLAKGSLSQIKFAQESKIRLLAHKRSIRQTFAVALAMILSYFLLGTLIVVHVGGQTLDQALLYCVYTMTSSGFGSVKVPLTQSFLVFLIFLMYFGVASITLVVRICISLLVPYHLHSVLASYHPSINPPVCPGFPSLSLHIFGSIQHKATHRQGESPASFCLR